eukprot:CAMPEP_0184403444 /NCGR_PEP_ID=MMETSP0007-20130409/85410_1 /TAXON_ID=97485 /ORGANISM="Prymnesium parvum, Strain Texoma1" /LENGTH=92 /DNA_ID=CAMNT_0026759543 /DNA_START=724 /DNA_END=1003 /DNA_ORIENTATION=+
MRGRADIDKVSVSGRALVRGVAEPASMLAGHSLSPLLDYFAAFAAHAEGGVLEPEERLHLGVPFGHDLRNMSQAANQALNRRPIDFSLLEHG